MRPRERIEAELTEHRARLRLRWLEPDEIRARSRGRIIDPYGMNTRTGKPERGGILCARTFGPVESLCCLCTKYSGELHRGITCEKCGVDVLDASIRCERFGHLELPVAVPHPWEPERPLQYLLVLPAGLREPLPTERRPDLSGTNGLYQRVLQRAAQLERCVRYCAPELIVEHETARLGRAIARLLGRPRLRTSAGPSLTERLQRSLHELAPRAELPWEAVATLAALGLTMEHAERT
jgi:DNA-directed RNA polymerase beta' subunit